MSEQVIYMDGIEICTEDLGNPNNPPILLIMGVTASMICWEDGFWPIRGDMSSAMITVM